MKKLIFILLFISACCSTQIPIPCPTPQPAEDKITYHDGESADAWRRAETEELITALENSNPKKWILDITKRVALCELREIDIYLKYNKVIFRVSVFEDGTLFADGTKQDISYEQNIRMVLLFETIKEANEK